VTDEADRFRAPRARAVAELPLEALLARANELTRRWAVALVLASPLDCLGTIPLEDVAREGPALLALTLHALTAETELDRLLGSDTDRAGQPSPAVRLRALAGARDDPSAVVATEALRGVLWEALFDQLHEPSAQQVADASDRLAYVCSRVLAATLRRGDGSAPQPAPAPAGERSLAVSAHAPAAGISVAIVDERAGAPSRAGRVWPRRGPDRVAAPSAASSPGDAAVVLARHPEIEIRDERGAGGPGAWVGSIGLALERFHQDGLPFAVLLVELQDIVRLGAGEASARLADQLEAVLDAELRRLAPEGAARGGPGRPASRGSLMRESPGRYWLLVSKTNRAGARALAERLMYAAQGGQREQQLELAVGTAVCPEDGRDAPALAAHADLDLYAARSLKGRRGGWVDEPA